MSGPIIGLNVQLTLAGLGTIKVERLFEPIPLELDRLDLDPRIDMLGDSLTPGTFERVTEQIASWTPTRGSWDPGRARLELRSDGARPIEPITFGYPGAPGEVDRSGDPRYELVECRICESLVWRRMDELERRNAYPVCRDRECRSLACKSRQGWRTDPG